MSYSTLHADDKADDAKPAPALSEQIRAYRTKQTSRRVPAGASIEDQKEWVGKHLKHYELTLDDLPLGFWDESLEKRRELLRRLRRYGKRAKRRVAGGYPANYYGLPEDERRRIGNAVRQRRWRSANRPAPAPKPVRALPPDPITDSSWARDRLTLLMTWTAETNSRARQLRGREIEIVKAAAHHQTLSGTLGRQPSLGEFAGRLGCTRAAAQKRVRVLQSLYSEGGAWHAKALRAVSPSKSVTRCITLETP